MTPELKAKWLEDLRSGKYPKTRNKLKDDTGGYCCLGVLLETIGVGFSSDTIKDSRGDPCGYKPHLRADGVALNNINELSSAGLDLVGLAKFQQDALTKLNDENETFAEVIGYIESRI